MRIPRLQFGNQINLDHANPTLTESYGNWGTRRNPCFGGDPRQEIHGSGTFIRTTPIRQPRSRLMRLLTQSGLCTKSGQQPVDGLHSIENTCGCRCQFFIDSKFGRSTNRHTRSPDNFLTHFNSNRSLGLQPLAAMRLTKEMNWRTGCGDSARRCPPQERTAGFVTVDRGRPPFATKRSQKSDEVLEPNHEGPIPGSESNREGYRARAERDQGAPLCDSFARRGRGLDREWSRSASLRVTVSRSRNCSGPNHAEFVTSSASLNNPIVMRSRPRQLPSFYSDAGKKLWDSCKTLKLIMY